MALPLRLASPGNDSDFHPINSETSQQPLLLLAGMRMVLQEHSQEQTVKG